MNVAGTRPQPLPETQPRSVRRLLLPLVLLSGILVVSPFFRLGSQTLGLAILAFALFLPYLVVCWRLLRTPGTKEGPGLAAGIGAMFAVIGAVGCALTIAERSHMKLAYFAALALLHGVLAGLGFVAFRQGTAKKAAWRVAVRSLIDPIVYYGIVFFLALAALAHH